MPPSGGHQAKPRSANAVVYFERTKTAGCGIDNNEREARRYRVELDDVAGLLHSLDDHSSPGMRLKTWSSVTGEVSQRSQLSNTSASFCRECT